MKVTIIDDARVLANAASIDDAMLARLAADDSLAASLALEMRQADRAPHVGDEADRAAPCPLCAATGRESTPAGSDRCGLCHGTRTAPTCDTCCRRPAADLDEDHRPICAACSADLNAVVLAGGIDGCTCAGVPLRPSAEEMRRAALCACNTYQTRRYLLRAAARRDHRAITFDARFAARAS